VGGNEQIRSNLSKHDFRLSDVREYYSLLAIDLRALNIFAA